MLPVMLIISYRLFYDLQALYTYHVDSLAHVKALRKPTMIGIEKSQYILMRSLISFINPNAFFDELKRINHISNTL
jgi:hypothetical protein